MSKLGTQALGNQYLTFALRLILGAIFIFAGAAKLPIQNEFIESIYSYYLLPEDLAHIYGILLPRVEFLIGACLVLGLFLRFAGGVSILMSLSFIVANSVAIFHKGGYCAQCFGQAVSIPLSGTIIIDVLMMAMALQILFHKGEFLSVDCWLLKE